MKIGKNLLKNVFNYDKTYVTEKIENLTPQQFLQGIDFIKSAIHFKLRNICRYMHNTKTPSKSMSIY